MAGRIRLAAHRASFPALLFAASVLTGCATTMHIGSPPPISKLGALTPGISTTADITAVLGQPQGHGGTIMPGTPAQDLWVYAAQDMEGSSAHIRILLVLVDPPTQRYSGFIWFRSGQLLSRKE